MSRSSSGPSSVDELEAAAVAAAAFAVYALEDSKGTMDQRPTSPSTWASLIKSKSKKDKATQSPEPGASPPRSSGEVLTTKREGGPETQARSPNLQKSHTFTDQIPEKPNSISPSIPPPPPPPPAPPPPPPPPRPSQSIGKPTTPQFPVNSSSMRPETSPRIPNKPSTPSSHPQQKATSGSASGGKTKADVWEKTEMKKIRERYEKLNETIASWEERKKKKAKAKLENTEREPAQRRSKAMEKFKEKMESINQIAGGARAQAEARQRKEELKVKEKANEYRRTGKLPRTCFCF